MREKDNGTFVIPYVSVPTFHISSEHGICCLNQPGNNIKLADFKSLISLHD